MSIHRMKRRTFIAALGGAVAWPFSARGQQQSMSVVAFVNGGGGEAGIAARYAAAFRKGLSETGWVEGRNITVEYHWLKGEYERAPALIADLVQRRVAVIATPGFPPGALAAKDATSTIPIVFGVGDDPVKLGLVASVARPGSNVTGINFFVTEIVSKRLALLHELVPNAVRIAVLVNPGYAAGAETTLKEAREVAPRMRLRIRALNASTAGEIDAAFASLAQEQVDALLVGGDGFLNSRSYQIARLAARAQLPTAGASREFVEAGCLMSYGADISDMFRQAGIYVGSIVKGATPANLPVLQSTKLEFIMNLQTAKMLGLEIPPQLLARADEVIE
jgi:putative ABC transport system substrate-binding protein